MKQVGIWEERLMQLPACRIPGNTTAETVYEEMCSPWKQHTWQAFCDVTRNKPALEMGFAIAAQILLQRILSAESTDASYVVGVCMGSSVLPCVTTCHERMTVKELLNTVMHDLKFLHTSVEAYTFVAKYGKEGAEAQTASLQNGVTVVHPALSVCDPRRQALHLCVSLGQDGILWTYDAGKYPQQEITYLSELYETILLRMTQHMEDPLRILHDEITDELCRYYGTADDVQPAPDIMEQFLAYAQAHPGQTAIVAGQQEITYASAVKHIQKLAAVYHASGIHTGDVVAVLCDHSAFTLLAIWALYYLGAVYLPMDLTTPVQKRNILLAEGGARMMVCQTAPEQLPDIPVLELSLEQVLAMEVSDFPYTRADSVPSYIIFTSGSTGKPKGIAISRQDTAQMCRCYQSLIGLDASCRCMFLNHYNFDGSIKTIYSVLYSGAVAVCAPEDLKDIPTVLAAIEEGKITHLASVPLMLQTLLCPDHLTQTSSLVCVISGGEAFRTGGITEWIKERRKPCCFWNIYGPAECTCFSAAHPVREEEFSEGIVPIGKSVPGKRIYVLEGRSLCPPGVRGEICISGWGVAEGYLNKDDFPAEQDFFNQRKRMYRTGDIGMYRPDGTLLCLGRADAQFKVAGQRTEAGEIEAAARLHPAVANAILLIGGEVEKPYLTLVYEVLPEHTLTEEELLQHLRQHLYAGAVPNELVSMEKIPVGENGKTDRNLTSEALRAVCRRAEVMLPTGGITSAVLQIWEKVIGKPVRSLQANFFELGGYSLLLYRVVKEINEAFETNVTIMDVMEHSSVAEMAEFLQNTLDKRTRSEREGSELYV